MARELNFFFFYGSTYTYLSVMRVANLASAADLTVRWRPFNVRQIMIETNNIPFAGKPAKAAYMWRDIARRAAGHRVGGAEVAAEEDRRAEVAERRRPPARGWGLEAF